MNTKIWAHRGASGYAPENTLAAFALAVKQGADGIELDVQMTKDQELVVIHDETVDRVSNGNGAVRDYTLKEIKKLNVSKTIAGYEAATIPTLQEVYELIEPTDLVINVEVKTGIVFYLGIEEKILALTEKCKMEDRVCYSSFNHETLKRIKEFKPDAKCGILFADGWLHPAYYAKDHGMDYLHPAFYNLQFPWFMEDARQTGRKVHAWTVNRTKDMIAAYQLGVDAIITNYPDKAAKIAVKM